MNKDHSLDDIFKIISDKFSDPKTNLFRAGIVDTICVINPTMGVAAEFGNGLLSYYDEFKLNELLIGLSCESNIEKRLNQLYTYVNSNVEKAAIVANIFKRTINAESSKVCFLYGLVLADHLVKNDSYSYDDLIVCRALEDANDFDLNNFKQIMEVFLKPKLDESKEVGACQVSFSMDFEHEVEFITTCDWCVYNRLFTSHGPEWGVIETSLSHDMNYYATKAAVLLLEYIQKARQTWNYQEE